MELEVNEPPSVTLFDELLQKILRGVEEYSELLSKCEASEPADPIEEAQMSLQKGEHSFSLFCKAMQMRKCTLKKRSEEACHRLSIGQGRLPNDGSEVMKQHVERP
jgi:hypothetical protein